MYPRRIYAHAMLSLLLLSSATSNAMNQWLPHMPQRKDLPLVCATVSITIATLLGLHALTNMVKRSVKGNVSLDPEQVGTWVQQYEFTNNAAMEADQEKLKKKAERQKVLKSITPKKFMHEYTDEKGAINAEKIRNDLTTCNMLRDVALKGKQEDAKELWTSHVHIVKNKEQQVKMPSWANAYIQSVAKINFENSASWSEV